MSEDMTYTETALTMAQLQQRNAELAGTLHRRNARIAELEQELADMRDERAEAISLMMNFQQERDELRAILDYIDKFAGPADKTCYEPGISLSEAARRELADMGKIDYAWRKAVQP